MDCLQFQCWVNLLWTK